MIERAVESITVIKCGRNLSAASERMDGDGVQRAFRDFSALGLGFGCRVGFDVWYRDCVGWS